MTSSATPPPHLPGASTRPQTVKPSVLWAYAGAVLAVLGLIIGGGSVAMGFLSGDGPAELGRTDFPGQVQFESPARNEPLAIYLERSTLSGDPGLPGYLAPIVTRGDGEVPVDIEAKVERHAGMSSEMIPIGVFEAVGGEYTVTVDPDGSTDGTDVAIVVADPNIDASGDLLMIQGGIVGAAMFLVGTVTLVTVGRARDRARVRALVESRASAVADGSP